MRTADLKWLQIFLLEIFCYLLCNERHTSAVTMVMPSAINVIKVGAEFLTIQNYPSYVTTELRQ